MKKKLLSLAAIFFSTISLAQVINYNEIISGDFPATPCTSSFTLSIAGVHSFTCILEPTPFPGGSDYFQVVVPVGFTITNYTYNLAGVNGVNVFNSFDHTASGIPTTSGTGVVGNSVNYTFPVPLIAGTYCIQTFANFNPASLPYTITITTAPSGFPVPITLASFTGKKEAAANVLNWTTSSEQNNAYFYVQRSEDANEFTTIGKINTKAANGNSSENINYAFLDKDPIKGHNYYRFQQIDIDGNATESNIIDLFRTFDGSIINIYPNPTKSLVNVDFSMTNKIATTIKLVDVSGRVMKEVQASKETSTMQLNVNDIAIGIYMLQIVQANKIISIHKVEKK